MLRVKVSDNGYGFDLKQHEILFNPNAKKVHLASKNNMFVPNLNLKEDKLMEINFLSAKLLCEYLGGQIKIESQIGKGTNVMFTIQINSTYTQQHSSKLITGSLDKKKKAKKSTPKKRRDPQKRFSGCFK